MVNSNVFKTASLTAAVLLALLGLSACVEDRPPPPCSETFKYALEGAFGTSITANRARCAAEYAKLLADTPPTTFALVGRSIRIGKSVYSVDGMVATRTELPIRDIRDEPLPAISIRQGRQNVWLRFQSDEQADTAFAQIAEAIAGTPAEGTDSSSGPSQ